MELETTKDSLDKNIYIPEEIEGFYSSYSSYVNKNLGTEKDNSEHYNTQYENINIKTDDPRFIYFLETLNSLQKETETANTTLIYPTEDTLYAKKRIMKCSEDLSNFSFSGRSYPGSLLSVILGIQELQQAETQEIGLHSTAIYDKFNKKTHLIISKSGLGKTTYSYLLENFSNNRFVLIGDEWNLLDLDTLTIRNRVPIIGDIKNRDLRPLFLASMPIEKRVYVGNKAFWANPNYLPNRKTNLGKIILLVKDFNNFNVNEDIIKSHKNIPFIGCNFSAIPKAYQARYSVIENKITRIIDKFYNLPNLYPVEVTNSHTEYKQTLDKILKTIDN